MKILILIKKNILIIGENINSNKKKILIVDEHNHDNNYNNDNYNDFNNLIINN